MRGIKAIREAEASADGTGISCIEVMREAMVGYRGAEARTMDKRLAVLRDVGTSSVVLE